jgi:ribonuclease VapC
LSPEAARQRVKLFLDELGFEVVSIESREFALATAAYARYGKGRNPAKLNMGDCFAYACAKAHGAALLFKGDDFVLTDIGSAMPRDATGQLP